MWAVPQRGVKFIKANAPCTVVNKAFRCAVPALYGIFRSFVVFIRVISGVEGCRLCTPPAAISAFAAVRSFNLACSEMLKILQRFQHGISIKLGFLS